MLSPSSPCGCSFASRSEQHLLALFASKTRPRASLRAGFVVDLSRRVIKASPPNHVMLSAGRVFARKRHGVMVFGWPPSPLHVPHREHDYLYGRCASSARGRAWSASVKRRGGSRHRSYPSLLRPASIMASWCSASPPNRPSLPLAVARNSPATDRGRRTTRALNPQPAYINFQKSGSARTRPLPNQGRPSKARLFPFVLMGKDVLARTACPADGTARRGSGRRCSSGGSRGGGGCRLRSRHRCPRPFRSQSWSRPATRSASPRDLSLDTTPHASASHPDRQASRGARRSSTRRRCGCRPATKRAQSRPSR